MSSKGEKKSAPKRLFSFDSVKPSNPKRSSSEGETWGHSRAWSKGSTLAGVREGGDGGDSDFPQVHRAMSPLQDPFASRPGSPALTRFEAPRPGSAASTRPKTPDGARSASPARRWDTIRTHVLATTSRPSTPTTPPTHAPRPSVASSLSSARPSTPKPSRFPRLGFRQVVDHAKEANDTRKFAEEVLRACLNIRYPQDGHVKGKSEKDNQSTIGGGSSMYLPFMNSSAGVNASSGINATGASKKSEKRQSQTSLALSNPPPKNTSPTKGLHQILLYHSAPPSDSVFVPTYLPHEGHILSTLLYPFEQPGTTGRWEEDRAIAVEAFELAVKGWLPQDESASAERVMWCCKASLTAASPNRSRVLSILRHLLLPGERNRWVLSPVIFQSLAHGLFVLQTFLHSPQGAPLIQTELDLSKDLLDRFLAGSYGEVNEVMVEEEYGVVALPQDTKSTLRKAIFLEAMVRCIEHCTATTRAWLLLNVTEDYWPTPTERTTRTALQMTIHSRKLITFCRAAYTLLHTPELEGVERHAVSQQIMKFLDSRVIPETESLDQTLSLETRAGVVKVVAGCLALDLGKELLSWAAAKICLWLNTKDAHWKSSLDKFLQRTISLSPWPEVTNLFSSVIRNIPEPDRKTIASIALPMLNDRMMNDPPPDNNKELANLLGTLSREHPTVFFKPLFLSAVSTKEFTVINHLCTIVIYSRYVEDFWTRNAEMLSMALLSDTGSSQENVSRSSANHVSWTVARLGQSVLMVEFIHRLQTIRRMKESASPDSASMNKFVATLENRLAVLVEAREKKAPIAPSQRMLLCMIFRELRLLTRSLKPASWLQRTINWFAESYIDEDLAGDLEREVHEAMDRIHALYAAAQSGARHTQQQRRSTVVLPSAAHQTRESNAGPSPSTTLDVPALFESRRPLLDGLLKGFPSKALKLFVVVSAMLNEADYRRIAPILWENGLTDAVDASTTASACFLIMQCAEKTSMDTLALIEVELRSSDDMTRLEAVRKIAVLVNWRFQITSQAILTDRTHRPFKMARIPLPFVPTDMGTTLYIPIEDASESGGKSEVPVELKKQLAELGWVDEESGAIDSQQIWIKTPMSMFPISQLDRMELGAGANPLDLGLNSPGIPSPQPSPRRGGRKDGNEDGGVLRRNSTSGGPVASQKRRAVFVPPLSNIFIRLTRLLHDPNFIVASSTRSLLLDLMRNDPPLLSRPVMDILAGEHKDIQSAISTLSSFLQVHQALPPPMAHTIFNHLMGFLKWSSRQYDMLDTLQDYGFTLSMLASVTTEVSGMSFREIRRSKTDPFVVPSGALWFPSSAPRGPMFPRGAEAFANPFEDITTTVISLSIVRISQNLLFLSLLKRNGQEVNLIRKGVSRFVLPSISPETTEPTAMELKDMIPGKQTQHYIHPDSTINTLSLVLARSHLMLLAQMFRAMSRHLSDRNELATMIDGINRILCTHGHDIGIVGHSMIALMVATTRFRRLFTSRTAYTLFIPALVKVYTESPQHPGIRPAIEYAVNRFYALHKESFLYQSLGIIGQMAMSPIIDEKTFADSVYTLIFSLTRGDTTVDAAGIHNVNKGQEREALIVDTAEEKPQTFLAAIRRADSGSSQLTILFPEEYEVDRLRMDNFVRLFLTVIAHDLSIIRAQHYLRLLRLLAPQLYNSSASTRAVLLDGISALGGIMVKGAPKSKNAEAAAGKDPGGMENHSTDQSRIQSDVKAMRLDYLRLVLKLGQAGGELSLKIALQFLDIVKLILKDAALSAFATGISSTSNPEADNRTLSTLLSDFVQMLLIREQSPTPKAVARFLQTLAPILHGYIGALDFTAIYETVRQLSLLPVYASEPAFAQVVVGEVCTAGLAACELAASENQYRLLLALPFRIALVRLLGECIFLQGADVVAEIEKRAPTYPFLAGVVFPLVLELKTDSQLSADGLRTQQWHRTVLASAWLRLIFYAMGACQKSLLNSQGKDEGGSGLLSVTGSVSGSIRSRSRENGAEEEAASGKGRQRGRGVTSSLRLQVPIFAVGLQIVKAIIVRAELDISSSILGIWERLANFVKAMVADGNANFAVRGRGADGWGSAMASEVPSPTISPAVSPRASAQLNPVSDGGVRGSNVFIHSPSSPSFKFPSFTAGDFSGIGRALKRPRVLDYMLWSILEFVSAYRSPLRLQLRLLATEKIVALDGQLRLKGIPGSAGRSPMSSHPPSPRSRRVSALFLKNRGERGLRTPAASPEVSPLLLPQSTPNHQPPPLSLDTQSNSPFLDVQQPTSVSLNQRRPGYQMSPVTPVDRPLGIPRIVHLGPTTPSALRTQPYPVSPSGLLASNSNGPGSRMSTLGAGLRAGLGGFAAGGSGRKKEKDSGRGNSGRGGDDLTGSDLIRATKIKSVKLVEGTYRRIRCVQALMGYDLLLPLSHTWSGRIPKEDGLDEEDSEVELKSWTKSQALAAISQEMKDLLEEFEFWMAAVGVSDGQDDSDDDENGLEEPQGLDATRPPSIQVVNDFGMLAPSSGGFGGSAPATPVFRSDDRASLLHPHSFVPPRRDQRSRHEEDRESLFGNDQSSIIIEVDSTFVVESPNPSPIMTFQPQRRQTQMDG